eukprot:770066-Rhodomonas_salina.1
MLANQEIGYEEETAVEEKEFRTAGREGSLPHQYLGTAPRIPSRYNTTSERGGAEWNRAAPTMAGENEEKR